MKEIFLEKANKNKLMFLSKMKKVLVENLNMILLLQMMILLYNDLKHLSDQPKQQKC